MICIKRLITILLIIAIIAIIFNSQYENFGVYPSRYGHRYRHHYRYRPYKYRYRYRYNPWYLYDYVSPWSWYYYWRRPYDYSQVQPLLS